MREWKSVFSQYKLPHCQLRCELGKTLHCPKDNLIGKARHCGLVLKSCRRDLLWPCFPAEKRIYLNFTHFVYTASDRLMRKGLIVRDRHTEKEKREAVLIKLHFYYLPANYYSFFYLLVVKTVAQSRLHRRKGCSRAS